MTLINILLICAFVVGVLAIVGQLAILVDNLRQLKLARLARIARRRGLAGRGAIDEQCNYAWKDAGKNPR